MVSPRGPAQAASPAAANSLEGLIALGMGEFVKRYLLIFVLVFVGVVSTVFTVSALRAMSQLAQGQFVSEADASAADLRVEIDHLLLRLKDAANYVTSDASLLQLAKVQNKVNGSRYVTDLGYITPGDRQRHSLMKPQDAAPRDIAQIRDLATITRQQPGYASVIDPDRYNSLFHDAPPRRTGPDPEHAAHHG